MDAESALGRSHGLRALPWLVAAGWVLWQWAARAEGLSWGWDESAHAQLPAVRIALYLRVGDLGGVFDAIHSCTQYPFVWPAVLGLVQAVSGPSEAVARAVGVVVWGLTMVGAHVLTRSVASQLAVGESVRRWAPWGALAACAGSPLGAAYAGTLFHAVPSACVTVWALVAWVGRDAERPRTDWVAGAALALAFFTKFNYGLLLGAACAVAFAVECVGAVRAGGGRQLVGRGVRLAVPMLGMCAWWFVLPLPGGFEVGAIHREAFVGFLRGNLATDYLSPARRIVEWGAGLHAQPRVLLLVLAGVVLAMRHIGRPAGRVLGAAAILPAVFLWAHPFHLDRFLVPFAPALWCLAAIGCVDWASTGERVRRSAWIILALVLVPLGGADARALAGMVGLVPEGEPQRAYVMGALERLGRVGSGRRRPTAGLRAESAAGILDACAAATSGMERVGWLGVSSELSGVALHLGLLERGGEVERFLRDAQRPVDVTFLGVDPEWDDARFAAWAGEFDVLFMSDPPDLGGRRVREFMRGYQERLIALGWRPSELGVFEWRTALGGTQSVRIYACRPPA